MIFKRFVLAAVIILAACLTLGCSAYNPYYNTYDLSGEEDPGFTGLSKAYEALNWLEGNPNESAFASNRFGETQNAKDFIQNLYDMGATVVLITGIFDEEWRIKEEGGPYADTLIVTLPADREKREAILEIYRVEYENEYGEEPTGISGDALYFWWD